MDIMLLKEFLELAHYSNYTEAARAIPISQSTLSKHIQQMERTLGYTLVERDKQRVVLSPQGRIVAEHAASIVSDFERMKQELEHGGGIRVELNIGGVFQDREVMQLFSRAKAQLESRGIECLFNFRAVATMPYSHELATGHLDLLVTPPTHFDASTVLLGSRQLYSSPFVACVLNDEPLADRASLSMADLRGMTFIRLVGNHFNESWDFIENLCRESGFTPSTRECFLGSPHELSLLKLNRNEVFMVCESSLQDVIFLTDPNLVQIPIENTVFPISCYYIENPMSESVELFLEALETVQKG